MAGNVQSWTFDCEGCGESVRQGAPSEFVQAMLDNGDIIHANVCGKCLKIFRKHNEEQAKKEAAADKLKPPKKPMFERPADAPPPVSTKLQADLIEQREGEPARKVPERMIDEDEDERAYEIEPPKPFSLNPAEFRGAPKSDPMEKVAALLAAMIQRQDHMNELLQNYLFEPEAPEPPPPPKPKVKSRYQQREERLTRYRRSR